LEEHQRKKKHDIKEILAEEKKEQKKAIKREYDRSYGEMKSLKKREMELKDAAREKWKK